MGGRREGHTQAAMLLRQEQVQRLSLRGLTPTEISKQTMVSVRTVQRDLEAIRANLMQIVQAQEIRTLRLANAELDEIWREAWILYHRPPREVPAKDGTGLTIIREDDRQMKAKLLSILLNISAEKNHLTLSQAQPPPPTSMNMQTSEEAVATFINSLSPKLRDAVVGQLEQRASIL